MNEENKKDSGRRKRRYDPMRRERLIAVTLEVIEQYGVAGTSTRKVAEIADVSLGSLTYYFESINHLLEEAFTHLSIKISNAFSERLGAARNREEALTAVVDIIDQNIWGSPQTLTLSFELYSFVSRNPHLQPLPQRWMEQSRQALEQHFTPSTARALDALIEGIGIHNHFDEEPMPRVEIESLIRQVASRD
ncbi:TPA: TetR/AcrR family transcriptional regulator [Klebsiella oxytoca]